jgi:O-glycosyl hydrolase
MKFKEILTLCLITIGCTSNQSNNDSPNSDATPVIEIDVSKQFQTIRNFGASDAWTIQFLGKWPEPKKEKVADWLFSNEVSAEGKPIGIGLSLWRFNIGAGTAGTTDISDEWRRSEGFLNDDGSTYNWEKQAGERWFLNAAKARGVKNILAFVNSPPVQLTKNGKGFSSNGNQANIDPNNYLAHSKFLVEVIRHFNDSEGITFNYISPFNEPQWDWTGNGQEGTPYTNQEIYDITKILDSVLTAAKLPTKIQIAEAGKLNYLYEVADKPGRGNQINDFFNESSSLYLGKLPNVDKVITGHSYFTSAPVEKMVSVRESVRNKIQSNPVPIEFWQSEYCILGDEEEVKGPGKDRGIDPALYVARLIHHDLTVSNASAWHWWLAVSAYDYKDGLIYIDKNKEDGNIEDTKLLWALGNYSRFIIPGSVRVGVRGTNINSNNPNGLMVSSYLSEQDRKLVTVIVNYAASKQSLRINLKGADIESFKPYVTSGSSGFDLKPLEEVAKTDLLVVPERSVVTLVSDVK